MKLIIMTILKAGAQKKAQERAALRAKAQKFEYAIFRNDGEQGDGRKRAQDRLYEGLSRSDWVAREMDRRGWVA